MMENKEESKKMKRKGNETKGGERKIMKRKREIKQ